MRWRKDGFRASSCRRFTRCPHRAYVTAARTSLTGSCEFLSPAHRFRWCEGEAHHRGPPARRVILAARVATVAVAREPAVLAWRLLTRGEDYAFARPSLVRREIRRLELTAGAPPRQARPEARLRLEHDRRQRRETPGAAGRGRLSTPGRRLAGDRAHGGCGRDTGARIFKGPRRARPRGRSQAPGTCTSPRQSPAPTRRLPRPTPNVQPNLTFRKSTALERVTAGLVMPRRTDGRASAARAPRACDGWREWQPGAFAACAGGRQIPAEALGKLKHVRTARPRDRRCARPATRRGTAAEEPRHALSISNTAVVRAGEGVETFATRVITSAGVFA
jgi:hypothetical protein